MKSIVRAERMKLLWSNPEFRDKISKKISQTVKERWKEGCYPNAGTAQSKWLKNKWQEKDFRDKQIKIIKERSSSTDFSEERSKIAKQNWKNGIKGFTSNEIKQRWKSGVYDTEKFKSTRGYHNNKLYYYNGIRMKSNWEVKYAEHLDSLKLSWKYEPKTFILSNGKRYTPDFYIEDTNEWHEVKGWMTASANEKINMIKKDYGIIIRIINEEFFENETRRIFA